MRDYLHQFSDNTDKLQLLCPNLPKYGFWGPNIKNLSLHLQPAPFRYYVHQFSNKANNFHFFGATFSKNDFCGWNFKNLSLDLELASWRYYVNQFSGKTDNFEFVCLNLSKKLILGWRYQKSKSQIVIRTLEILCAPIFRQKGQLWIFAPKFDQKRIFGWNIKNLILN